MFFPDSGKESKLLCWFPGMRSLRFCTSLYYSNFLNLHSLLLCSLRWPPTLDPPALYDDRHAALTLLDPPAPASYTLRRQACCTNSTCGFSTGDTRTQSSDTGHPLGLCIQFLNFKKIQIFPIKNVFSKTKPKNPEFILCKLLFIQHVIRRNKAHDPGSTQHTLLTKSHQAKG